MKIISRFVAGTFVVIRRIFFFLSVSLIYCLVFQLFYNLLKYDTAIPYRNINEFFTSTCYNLIPILIIIFLNYFTVFYVFQTPKFTRRFVLKLTLDFFVSYIILFLVNHLFLLIVRFWEPEINVDNTGTILNNILIFFGVETVYYITSSRRLLKKIEYERRKVLQYQYDALKAQINPHFLFNSLNILYSLVSLDVQKSKEFILALSSMYRYILNQQNKRVIKMKEEFDFVDAYISVLKMRFHNQFNVEFIGWENIKNEKIIPYTLQLLIENVTKHNVISTNHPMMVSINITYNAITVSNPIRKKDSDSSSGIGLQYISEQYKIYGVDFRVEDNGKVFTAKIPYL